MAPGWEDSRLLQSLRRLRSKFVLRLLNRRMSCYSKDNGDVVCDDISDLLSSHIDSLSAPGASSNVQVRNSVTPKGKTKRKVKAKLRTDGSSEPMQTGLSTHLGSRRAGVFLENHVAEKLKQSTMEHIQTSLRFAQQGDARTARLHADIANNAQKEAAYYMASEEYIEFTASVQKRLKDLLK